MTIPNREAIIEEAFKKHQWKNYQVNSNTPTIQELHESGLFANARDTLMRSEDSEYRSYIEAEASRLGLLNYKVDVEVKRQKQVMFNVDEALNSGIFTSGTSSSGKTLLNCWFAKILMKHGITVYVLDPSQAWRNSPIQNVITVKEMRGKLTWSERSTVFDISFLTWQERMRFADLICKTLLDDRKSSKWRPPTFIFFEEGQLYFYQGSMRTPKQTPNVVELATNGRNFNLRYAVITQFASMIDKILVKITQQRYAGWSNETNDKKYWKGIIGKAWTEKLKSLTVGEFVYSNPKCVYRIRVPLFKRETAANQLEQVIA